MTTYEYHFVEDYSADTVLMAIHELQGDGWELFTLYSHLDSNQPTESGKHFAWFRRPVGKESFLDVH